MGEEAQSLFQIGSKSLSELSDFSLRGEPGEKRENILNNTPIIEAADEECPC